MRLPLTIIQYQSESGVMENNSLSAPFTFSIFLRDSQNFDPDQTYNKYYFTLNSLNSQINNYRSKLTIDTQR